MQVKKTPKWLLLLISCLMISFFFHSTSLGAYAEEKQEYSSNGSVTLYGEYKFEEESANPKDKKELPGTFGNGNDYVDRGASTSSLPDTIPQLGDSSYVRAKIFGTLILGMIGCMIVKERKKGVQA